jgi:hypothetical protein
MVGSWVTWVELETGSATAGKPGQRDDGASQRLIIVI